MLKKLIGAFFPSFTWEHGFALWGIDDAIGVGASVLGGLMGDDANNDAAGQIAASNAEVQRMIKEQQGSNDTAYSPYRRVGGAANARLEQLLGLTDYSKAGNYGTGDLINIDSQGRFVMNPELENNPQYRNAFNKWVAEHESMYGVDANINNNGLESPAEARISQFLGGQKWFDNYNSDAIKKAEAAKNDPAFGSLLSKFSQNDLNNDVVYNTGLQFGLDEGVKGLNRRAASGGSYDSGATLKALTRYANDYGTTKASGAYDRFMNDKNTTYNFLSGQQGVGLNATNSNQSLNTNLLSSAIGANQNAASQQAAYGLNGAASLNNGIMSGVGNYLYGKRLGDGGVLSGGTYGSGTSSAGGGINLSGYTSSIPWYA